MSQKKVDQYKARKNGHSKEQKKEKFYDWLERIVGVVVCVALVASALKIKPVMGSTDEGTICQLDQARGINKALIKMVQHVAEKTENSETKVLAISHCNCRERAMLLKDALQERLTTKEIIVLDTAGVSSMYANNGGVIVAV